MQDGDTRNCDDLLDEPDGTSRLVDQIVRFHRLGQLARSMLSTSDLGADPSALMLLFVLRAKGPMRVTDVAEVKQADPSTISRQAAQLVKAGLVRREADPVDGRASRLAVTEAGLAACRALREAQHALFGEALAHWPADRVDGFAALFEEFNSSVEALLRHSPAATPSTRENA